MNVNTIIKHAENLGAKVRGAKRKRAEQEIAAVIVDNKPIVSIIWHSGAYGDGVNTVEVWDFRENEPRAYVPIADACDIVADAINAARA